MPDVDDAEARIVLGFAGGQFQRQRLLPARRAGDGVVTIEIMARRNVPGEGQVAVSLTRHRQGEGLVRRKRSLTQGRTRQGEGQKSESGGQQSAEKPHGHLVGKRA